MAASNSLPLILLVALAAPASARQFTPVSQNRSVSVTASANDASGTPDTDSDTAQAPGFGPFSQTVNASASGSLGTASSSATQTSSIGVNHVSATGSGGASASAPQLEPGAGASAHTDSLFEFVFDVTAVSTYAAAGFVSRSGPNGSAGVTLSGTSGLVFLIGTGGGGSYLEPLDETGILVPGRYTLAIVASGAAGASKFYTTDGVGQFDVDFTVDAAPAKPYCTALPNSAGTPALMAATGSVSVAANDFGLEATGVVPGAQGLFFYGKTQTMVPFGSGFRCVGNHIYRLQPMVAADGPGRSARAIDFTVSPTGGPGSGAIHGGTTWNFQLWYRDPAAGGLGFNLSDGLSAAFEP